MSTRRGALSGLVAAAVALAVGELVAGIGGTRRAPVIVVGDAFIDRVPRGVKDWAIDTFGTADKVALLVGIYAVIALAAAGVGVLAVRRFVLGAAGIAVFGAVGVLAALAEDDTGTAEVLAPVLGALAGIAALRALIRRSGRALVGEADRLPPSTAERRVFLGLAAGAVVFATVGRALQGRVSAAASRMAVRLPRPTRRAGAIPDGADFGIDGLAPFVTANADFYRIDTALLVPQVTTDGWTLTITGRVDRELTLTYDDLLDRELVEADVTIACVSNEIGGDLVGNARWLGTPLLPLLDEAGIDPGADQLVARSVDGFTAGMPLTAIRDGRTALVAIGMNGVPLPIRHGFPARVIVAGLYGYVSATKWLEELELTTFADFDPYWIKRGWAVEAPVKTASRIDVARAGMIAGVAWAPTKGIEKVEVRIDEGPWRECELSHEVHGDTWRQWRYRWDDAESGEHIVTVRATDGTGETQTDERAEPFPDGATGWHSRRVRIS